MFLAIIFMHTVRLIAGRGDNVFSARTSKSKHNLGKRKQTSSVAFT